MINDLQELRVFTHIVSSGSLSAAATAMDVSLALVSKRLAALEARLGVRLIQRTTRRQALTPEGQAFHERSVRILAEVDDAEDLITGNREKVSGTLSMTAPRTFGRQYLVPLTTRFQLLHPHLSIRMNFSDDIVDLVASGLDVAFRFGSLQDSSLGARLIAPSYRILCAAPAYLERHGIPVHPAELEQHACIVYGARPSAHWIFHHKKAPVTAKIRGTFMVGDGETAQALALEGAGILFKSVWDVGAHIDSGRLIHIMPAYTAPTEPLHAVVPHARQLAPRVRQFVDFAVEELRQAWRWDEKG